MPGKSIRSEIGIGQRLLIVGLTEGNDVLVGGQWLPAVQGADAVVFITEWDQFRALDLDRLKDALKAPVVIDLRNIYRPAQMAAAGFTYVSVGRSTASPKS